VLLTTAECRSLV